MQAAARPLRALACLAALAVLAGCASSPRYPIDTSHTAVSQNSRVRFVVLHYTTASTERSLSILTRGRVSSHYLVTDDAPARILQLVDENRSAWHAGDSAWHGRTWLNNSSIGIEIVNPGWERDAAGVLHWRTPYSPSQIEALTELLRGIVRRHGIAPGNIVAHSDIAPGRKLDPGPLFPWRALAQAGLGRWYDEAAAAERQARYQREGVPDVAWFQAQLARVGYAPSRHGQADEDTLRALKAFQLHYRPSDFDGAFDAESAAILESLPD